MPTYTFIRNSDSTIHMKRMSFSDYEDIKTGRKEVADEATGEVLEIVFNPGAIGFVLKDGESGGWMSKALKENKYRAAHRVEMARREKDHVFKSRLVPNYQGEEAHSWSDVRDHVRTKKGVASASTYDSLVIREKQGA